MAEPFRFWSPADIAIATGCKEVAIRGHWPIICAALERLGIDDRPVQMAAIATVAIETANTFEPVREAFWLDEAWRQANLRYYPFFGRGYIQATWESNYKKYGDILGVDLVANPDRALEPLIAADILAHYFANHGGGPLIPQAARGGNWTEVRRLVQGGSAGLDRFRTIVTALGGAPMPVTYNRDTPPIAQDDPWSCAPTSLRWALTALGRNPGPTYIEDLMLRDGIVTREQGLMDASGGQLAAWIGKTGPEYYGSEGFYGQNEDPISWEWVVHEGGAPDGSGHAYPLLIGGRAWGHWSGVSTFDPARGVLILANPAPNWMAVGQTMDQATFNKLGPFSAVRVLHPDLLGAAPVPPIPPEPPKPTDREVLAEVRRQLVSTVAYIDAHTGG